MGRCSNSTLRPGFHLVRVRPVDRGRIKSRMSVRRVLRTTASPPGPNVSRQARNETEDLSGGADSRSPRFDYVPQPLPVYGLDAAREAHLESFRCQLEISASAVHPLPAHRPCASAPVCGPCASRSAGGFAQDRGASRSSTHQTPPRGTPVGTLRASTSLMSRTHPTAPLLS